VHVSQAGAETGRELGADVGAGADKRAAERIDGMGGQDRNSAQLVASTTSPADPPTLAVVKSLSAPKPR